MQNEPVENRSAKTVPDWEKRFDDEFGKRVYRCNGDLYLDDVTPFMMKAFIATALEEQRLRYVEAVNKLDYLNGEANPLVYRDDVLKILKKARG